MNREEYIAWCKELALAYVDRGELESAVTAMISDLSKRDDTRPNGILLITGMMYASDFDRAGVVRWIEGFH